MIKYHRHCLFWILIGWCSPSTVWWSVCRHPPQPPRPAQNGKTGSIAEDNLTATRPVLTMWPIYRSTVISWHARYRLKHKWRTRCLQTSSAVHVYAIALLSLGRQQPFKPKTFDSTLLCRLLHLHHAPTPKTLKILTNISNDNRRQHTLLVKVLVTIFSI